MSVGSDVIGREAELRTAAAFLDALAVGPAAMLLDGEAGIGKTTLWLAAAEQARERGHRVLQPHRGAAHLARKTAGVGHARGVAEGDVKGKKTPDTLDKRETVGPGQTAQARVALRLTHGRDYGRSA